MKKLQNDFTTLEQSKRLLELGVPADSADCYYMAIGLDAKKYGYSDFPYFMTTNYVDKVHVIEGVNFPCWSVGRLIEIDMLCDTKKHINCNGRALSLDAHNWYEDFTLIEWCINEIQGRIEDGDYDFSKLED